MVWILFQVFDVYYCMFVCIFFIPSVIICSERWTNGQRVLNFAWAKTINWNMMRIIKCKIYTFDNKWQITHWAEKRSKKERSRTSMAWSYYKRWKLIRKIIINSENLWWSAIFAVKKWIILFICNRNGCVQCKVNNGNNGYFHMHFKWKDIECDTSTNCTRFEWQILLRKSWQNLLTFKNKKGIKINMQCITQSSSAKQHKQPNDVEKRL